MRRTISFILVMLLLTAGSISAFAAGVTVPSDVKGTKYEAAVVSLMEKIGLKGYENGTFRPQNTINRAEMCTIIVKAMNPTEADLKAAPDAFQDIAGMKDYAWALSYVNYGASKKVVSGTGNNQFTPASPVTYNEVATMLVNALGYTDKDLTGSYPQNYVAKATELGIFKDVELAGRGDSAAIRGDVALMTAVVADQIVEKYKPTETDTSTGTEKPTTTGGAVTPPSDNSIFEAYGGAYGMINDVAKIVDKDKNKVDQIEFLMGGKTYYLNTDKENLVSAPSAYDGSIYYLKFNTNKDVKTVTTNPTGAKGFAELGGGSSWTEVAAREKSVITLAGGKEFTIMSDASFYKATFDGEDIDGYEKGSLSDIGKGALVRAYDVTDDKSSVADIVVYVTAEDAAKHME